MDLPAAFYVPSDGGFVATALTIGPWDSRWQHAGPPAALLAREVERAGGIVDGQTVRLTYDILGPVPVGPVGVRATVLRPGRRVELVEAVLDAAGGRPLMRLAAWRMRVREDLPADLAPRGLAEPAPLPPGPESGRPEVPEFFRDEVAYHRALEWRFVTGTFAAPGPATAWTRAACDLVEGEPMTPLQHLLVMTDAASGISAVVDWSRATFANVDLSVALHRPPQGGWVGMAARTVLSGAGAAQCFADLFDCDGGIGRSAQSLFVEPR